MPRPHLEAPAEAPVAPGTVAAILDAARESVLDVGVRRTTVADVARRAGVSRMTVYRAFPDLTRLLVTVLKREFGGLLDEIATVVQPLPTARERLVEGAVTGAEVLATHPLLLRFVEIDSELLTPYVVERFGATQQMAAAAFAAQVAEGQVDGSVRSGDPALLAHALVLIIQSFVLAAHVPAPADLGALLAELRAALDGYLRAEVTP